MAIDSVSGLTIGVDRNKINAYKDNLKRVVITETKNMLSQTQPIKDALDQCWKGHAKDVYKGNLDKTVESIQTALDRMYSVIDTEMNNIGKTWGYQDENMIDEV